MRFDEKAHTYNQFSQAQSDLVNWGIDLLPKEKTPSTIMEFGAGTGLFTKHITQKHEHVFATDISEFMIEQGQENVPEAFWAQMDAWNPLQNEKYDALYSSALLQWCPNPAFTLANWRNCIKDGGKLTALLFIDGTHKELQEIDSDFSALQWRTKEAWETAFDHANFTIESSDELSKVYTYKNAMDFLRTIHGTGSTNSEISNFSRVKKLIREYEDKYSTTNGVTATWHFYKIQCTA